MAQISQNAEVIHARIPSGDRQLAATIFRRPATLKSTLVPLALLINPGVAIPRGFYARYASYLVQQHGVDVVVTHDPRGQCESQLEKDDAKYIEWGEKDLTAMLAWVKSRFDQHKIVVLGHSAGGQMIAFAKNAELIDCMYQ